MTQNKNSNDRSNQQEKQEPLTDRRIHDYRESDNRRDGNIVSNTLPPPPPLPRTNDDDKK